MTMMDLNRIYDEYAIDDDIFTEDSDKIASLKDIIFNRLEEAERRIILLYAEEQSMRKIARHLGVSVATAYHTIRRIREKIIGFYGMC